MAVAYVAGTVVSGLAGVIGMHVATHANSRTAEAATQDIERSFMSSFRGGAVMGMTVVAFSTLGVTLLFWLSGDAGLLLGFSFGAFILSIVCEGGGRYLYQDR